MSIEKNDLNKLRQTILRHQWKEAYETVSLLFAEDVPQFTIFVANQMLQTHLRFRSRYDLEWVASFAQEVAAFIQTKHSDNKAPALPPQVHDIYGDAAYGVGNLIEGLVELWDSISVAHEVGEKTMHLVKALDHFIIAELCNYWDAVYPGEFQLVDTFHNAETTSEGRKILPADMDKEKLYRAISFLKQPESLGYRSARLLNLVDEIELRLNK